MVNTSMQREADSGMHRVTITRHGVTEIYTTVCPKAGEELSSMVDELGRWLRERNAEVVKFDVLGSVDGFSLCMDSLRNVCGQVNWPVMWVEGGSCSGGAVAGMQVYAVSRVPVETIFLDSRPVARVFEDPFAKYCILGNVLPDTSSLSPGEQTSHTLAKIERVLKLAGMDISNVVRTWFHNDSILGWYNEFNAVRNDFFQARGVFDGLVPASTGVGGKNPAHAALIASAVAIQAKQNSVTVQEVLSPLQGPAREYGSSFSRAVEVAMPGYRRVLVSGTASIEASGKTAHIGDVDKQVAFTMEVVRPSSPRGE